MKTKSILISMCLIIGFAATQVSGQDTKSVQVKEILGYATPVYCDNQMVDYVTGDVLFHIIAHYKDGEWQKEIIQCKGEVVGYYGENFEMKEVDKYWLPVYGLLTWHYNLIGDQGHHYIGFVTYSYITGEITVGKTVCINN